jgi:hypothetical protein
VHWAGRGNPVGAKSISGFSNWGDWLTLLCYLFSLLVDPKPLSSSLWFLFVFSAAAGVLHSKIQTKEISRSVFDRRSFIFLKNLPMNIQGEMWA